MKHTPPFKQGLAAPKPELHPRFVLPIKILEPPAF